MWTELVTKHLCRSHQLAALLTIQMCCPASSQHVNVILAQIGPYTGAVSNCRCCLLLQHIEAVVIWLSGRWGMNKLLCSNNNETPLSTNKLAAWPWSNLQGRKASAWRFAWAGVFPSQKQVNKLKLCVVAQIQARRRTVSSSVLGYLSGRWLSCL